MELAVQKRDWERACAFLATVCKTAKTAVSTMTGYERILDRQATADAKKKDKDIETRAISARRQELQTAAETAMIKKDSMPSLPEILQKREALEIIARTRVGIVAALRGLDVLTQRQKRAFL